MLTGAVAVFAGAVESFSVECDQYRIGEFAGGLANPPKGIAIRSYAFPLPPVEQGPCPVQDKSVRCVRLQSGSIPTQIIPD